MDSPERGLGFLIAPTGGIEMVSEEASVRQSLLLLFSTSPGERVMRPDYGCDLHRLTFSPNDDTTAGVAIHYVRTAVAKWEPRVELLRVDANRDPTEPGRLEMFVEYRVRATQRVERLDVPLSLTDAAVK